jgi:ATP-dependent RNA helicase DeaD
MSTLFSQLNLHPELVQAVADCGYTTPTPIQSAVIPLMLAGRDVIGQAQTGTGKTAAFALPILQRLQPGSNLAQALVLAPTRELALQISRSFTTYGLHHNVRLLAVYGGTPYARQVTRLRKGVDVVIGTPGRVLDLIRQGVLDLSGVHTVVLDEADEMLSMGFVEDIEAILAKTPPGRQTTLFSATLPLEIRRLADRYLQQPEAIAIQPEQLTVAAIEQRYVLMNPADKAAVLTRIFEVEPVTSALVFVRTRAETGELANELARRGFPAEALSGDLSQELREQVLERFRQGFIKVLVATDVAARGLDIHDLSHVFNVELPTDPEVYVHRIGRTGRAGKSGVAISLVVPQEQYRLRRIETLIRQRITRMPIPDAEEIRALREERLLNQVSIWLNRGRFKRERELVEKLVADGFDPLEIAAAALKVARAEEKDRPVAPVREVVELPQRSLRPGRGQTNRTGTRNRREGGHEEGMVRLALSKGRQQGIRPQDVVSTIARHANIPGYTLGKIRIHDQHTHVDVPEEFVSQVLALSGEYRIRKQPVMVVMA